MILFIILIKYTWVIFILFSYFQVSAPRSLIADWKNDEKLIKEYYELRNRILLIINIPWLVMGIGIIIGGVPTVWNYFYPQNGNPFVLLFFLSVIAIWFISLHWTFFRSGAEKVAKFQLFPFYVFGKRKEMTTTFFKSILVLMIMCGIVAIIVMFTQEIPTPFYNVNK